MEDYEPPAEFKGAKGKGKKKKDPNAPKRGQSSFMFFSNEVRSKVKEENPEFSFGEIVSCRVLKGIAHGGKPGSLVLFGFQGKKIGAMFKALEPEEKSKYEDLAKKDKERYTREMEAYKAKQQSEAAAAAAEDDDDDSDGVDDDQDDDDDDSDSD